MRRVLACTKCRGHKIKCVHNDKPPCSYCIQKGIPNECVLTFPETKRKNKDSKNEKRGKRCIASDDNIIKNSNLCEIQSMEGIFNIPNLSRFEPNVEILPVNSNTQGYPYLSIKDLILEIPHEFILTAIERIVKSFPELNFFHMPSLLIQGVGNLNPVVVGAVLSHVSLFHPFRCKRSNSITNKWLGENSFNVKNNVYEKLTLKTIFNNYGILLKPDLDVIQALLILSTVKWGHNEYYTSWMLHGIALRMIQALEFEETFQVMCKASPFLQENKIRTFWSAFALDRIICTGGNKYFAIQHYDNVQLPKSDSYSTSNFLTFPNSQMEISNIKNSEYGATINNFISYFTRFPESIYDREMAAIIKGYAIWGDIIQYINNDSIEFHCTDLPWDQESKIGKIIQELFGWWRVIPDDWKWSSEKYYSSNFGLRSSTVALMINCIYHHSIIFIYREFFPFLPYNVEKPSGPIGLPLLSEPPDKNYWINTAKVYFQSVRSLANLLETLLNDELNQPLDSEFTTSLLITPFFSLAAFICGIHSNYGLNFPWMDPDSYLYTNNENSPGNLKHCYENMVQILKLKNNFSAISDNWLNMLLKLHKVYEFVATHRDKVKDLKLEKQNFQQLVNAIESFSDDNLSFNSSLQQNGHGTHDQNITNNIFASYSINYPFYASMKTIIEPAYMHSYLDSRISSFTKQMFPLQQTVSPSVHQMQQNNRHILQSETDKIPSAFTDQQLDMLLQFPL